MGPVIHGVDVPGIPGTVMCDLSNAINCRITQVHIARRHINSRAQDVLAIFKFSIFHALEQIQVFCDRSVAVRAVFPGFGQRPPVFPDLLEQASVALKNARLHANLQTLSLTDPLTGLPNRRHLQIHMEKEVAAARRGRSLVVVVFDLDDFKEYNDTLGHLVGDDILRAFAQVLADENRAMNMVARYGGDEFVSVLSESYLDGAQLYTKRVTAGIANSDLLSQHGVTVSFGMAEFDRSSMKGVDDVLQAADADMYRVKAHRQQGGDPRRVASP